MIYTRLFSYSPSRCPLIPLFSPSQQISIFTHPRSCCPLQCSSILSLGLSLLVSIVMACPDPFLFLTAAIFRSSYTKTTPSSFPLQCDPLPYAVFSFRTMQSPSRYKKNSEVYCPISVIHFFFKSLLVTLFSIGLGFRQPVSLCRSDRYYLYCPIRSFCFGDHCLGNLNRQLGPYWQQAGTMKLLSINIYFNSFLHKLTYINWSPHLERCSQRSNNLPQ